jgi:hypothetical protein
MYDYLYNRPPLGTVQYKPLGDWAAPLPPVRGGKSKARLLPGGTDAQPAAAPAGEDLPKKETDPRFIRANAGQIPGWYDIPEYLRTDILAKSLEAEG